MLDILNPAAPQVQFQRAHLHQRHQVREAAHVDIDFRSVLLRDLQAREVLRQGLLRVLLEETFLVPALWTAQQRQRPTDQPREYPVGDLDVILGQSTVWSHPAADTVRDPDC